MFLYERSLLIYLYILKGFAIIAIFFFIVFICGMLGKLVCILLIVSLFFMEFILKVLKVNLVLNLCGWKRSNSHFNW
jgi:hypothetical protein